MTALALVGAGCGLREANEDANRTEAEIKTTLGVDAAVNFRVRAGGGGKNTVVIVRLKSTPPGDAASIKAKVNDIVNHTFRSHVDRVDVAL